MVRKKSKMNLTKTRKAMYVIFYALIVVSVMLATQFFVPVIQEFFTGSLFLLLPIIFFLLGAALLFLTLKGKLKKGILKKFLILTGASSTGFFVSIFLHNMFYALNTITSHIIVLKYLTEVIHVGFFIIAIPVCPIGFLVGIIGSIVLIIKKRKH